MIRKAVIPAAGLGTRLLFATKEQPKEMLPLFTRNKDGELCLKPLLQLVFEELHHGGFREFCFIVGRGKRVVEDFFTPDYDFVDYLKNLGKVKLASELAHFYEKIQNSVLVFINQPKPIGFGDAVYNARSFIADEAFLVHAGDDLVISRDNDHLKRLVNTFEKYGADVVLCVEKVKDPRNYGVIIGKKVSQKVYEVEKIVEKPKTPISNVAVVALYVFTPTIFQAIRQTRPDENGEVQLTNAIQQLLTRKGKVYAVELNRNERRIDIGTSTSYWRALTATHNQATA
jgi:UTP--glucose-1-phosphate uridylyltransferase